MAKQYFIIATVLILVLAFTGHLNAGTQPARQDFTYKTVFVYNFTKYIEWPQEAAAYHIAVFGKNQGAISAFERMVNAKSTSAKPLAMHVFSDVSALADCHIIFVPAEETPNIPGIKSHYHGAPTIIISEQPGAIELGSSINFIEQDGKLKFELKLKELQNTGLQISQNLVALAIIK